MKNIGVVVVVSALFLVTCVAAGMAQEVPTQPPATPQAAQPAQPSAEPASPPAQYRLQPEDVMRMTVVGELDLATEQIVDPQGYVNIPQIGGILAKGLTVQQLTDKIVEGLSKILREPKVQVSMINFRRPKVYVLGQVNRPGYQEIKIGDRIMEAIAQAGSFTENAFLEGATLTHSASNEAESLDLRALFYGGDMTRNLMLADGDTIYIPEDTTNKYYVLGEVLRPSMFRLKDNVTVMDAITNAGGPTDRGSLKGTCIVRGDPENPERIKLDINKLIKSGDTSQNVALKPGDVVYVPESSKPDWAKLSGIISAITNSSYLLRIWGL